MIDTEIATGKWQGILSACGVREEFLRNKHGPCPMCQGKDRFRFDDKQGRGTWICNQCGSGDGYTLLQKMNGWKFKDAILRVNEIAGTISSTSKEHLSRQVRRVDNSQKQVIVRKIWTESVRIKKGDPAWLYLTRRTEVEKIPTNLKFHPALEYRESGNRDGENDISYHPALIAPIVRPDGRGIGVHRIYLTEDGHKANVSSPKKFFVSEEMAGAYVPLFSHKDTLGLAEGIETAISASVKFDIPVWSVLMAAGFEKFTPPKGVKNIVIYGDNDASFTGQAAAYSCARRLTKDGFQVSVVIPEGVGSDWCRIK